MSEMLMTVFLCLAIAMLVFIMVLICINLYEIFEEPIIQRRMRQLRKSSQPWVTVLVYARDNEATIEASLNALVKSSYYNYDIVVVNDRSKDKTLQQTQEFIDSHSQFPISVITRHKVATAKSALLAGYKKSRKGEVVISLRAGTNVPKECIKRAVATKADKESAILRIQDSPSTTSISGIVQSLNNLLWLHSHTILVTDPKHIAPVKLEVSLELTSILVLVGIIIVSILTNEAIIIFYSWLIITSYLFAGIWLNSEGLMTKVKLSFSALSALFLLPVSSLIQGVSQFRTRN